MPSVLGWSMAERMRGRSSRNSRSATTRIGMAEAVSSRDLGCQRSLVAGRATELLERQGHGLDVLLAGVPHQAGERTRVDPRGEEGADRHVRDEVVTDGVEHGRSNGFLGLHHRCVRASIPSPHVAASEKNGTAE